MIISHINNVLVGCKAYIFHTPLTLLIHYIVLNQKQRSRSPLCFKSTIKSFDTPPTEFKETALNSRKNYIELIHNYFY